MKVWFLLSILSAGCCLQGAERVLWPAGETELRPSGDATLTRAGAWMEVVTGTKTKWPGARLCFKTGTRDLSTYGRMSIVASNTTDQARKLCVSVKNKVFQGSSPGGSLSIPPHQEATLQVRLSFAPWRLDGPLALEGMRGFPLSTAGGQAFDLRRTSEIHIFYTEPSVSSGFAVREVRVEGEQVCREKVLPAGTFLPFVDKFGQFKHDEWPGKIHSDAELVAAKEREDAWLAAHGTSPIPDADQYGGWAAGPQLKATGYFRTEKVKGKWWLVDPEGHLFFSHGVDCVGFGGATTGISFREDYFEWVPAKTDPDFGRFRATVSWPAAHGFYKEKEHLPYDTFSFSAANLLRKYGASWRECAGARVHDRMRAWGLNTIGNWSDPTIYSLDRTPYTACLGTHGLPRLKGSTGWWGALPDPFHPEFEKQFRVRARALAAKMKNDPWCLGVFVDNELSWNREERMVTVSEKYFSTIARILKEELPNHLYLGCRIAWGTDVIYRTAARYCDVVSVNIYSHHPERDLPADACDKPMIIGEFHFGALDRGMFHTGLVPTENQAERAAWYRDYVTDCLDHPRLVGAHWFQWQDQALTGRSDGENYQIGFVTGTDTPYPELVAAAQEMARTMYARRMGSIQTK